MGDMILKNQFSNSRLLCSMCRPSAECNFLLIRNGDDDHGPLRHRLRRLPADGNHGP